MGPEMLMLVVMLWFGVVSGLVLADYHLAMWVRESDEDSAEKNWPFAETPTIDSSRNALSEVFGSRNFQLYVFFTCVYITTATMLAL